MATQGDIQTRLKQRELAVDEERNRVLDDYYSGRSTAAQTAAQINGLKLQLQALKDKAQIDKDVATTTKLELEIRDLEQKYNVIQGALESGITDPSQLNVGAQSILNRKPEKPEKPNLSDQRLREQRLTDISSKALNAKSNEAAKPLIDEYNKNAPDDANFGLIWSDEWGKDQSRRVNLSRFGGLGKAREDAKQLGIPLHDYLQKIYKHPNYKD
ncbi:MAG: hypothetical protein KKD77_20975 [Gammaproteobacteria bacterium]|nr:hypothetical protein [Gammaproteobacteria bacterium]